MRIVLFGDVHLYRLGLAPWHMLSKRLLGQTNLWLNRRKMFSPPLIHDVIERINMIRPDLLICPGDLTTTALHSEFRAARHALADLLATQRSFITPGNHDRYTFTATRRKRFESYFADHTAEHWPHHEQVATDTHLIALDSAKPNLIFDVGRVGDAQRQKLADTLSLLPRDHRVIIMCHYTLGTPAGFKPESPRHGLADESALVDVLRAAARPLLYVHGHVHHPWCFRHPNAPNVVAINAGSPTHVDKHHPHGQGFWQIEPASGDHQPWTLTHHTHDATGQWSANYIDFPSRS